MGLLRPTVCKGGNGRKGVGIPSRKDLGCGAMKSPKDTQEERLLFVLSKHNIPAPDSNLSRKGFCRNPRGIYPKYRVNFAGGYLVDFSGLFPLGKQDGKSTQQYSNQNSGASLTKSTLQGSALVKLSVSLACELRCLLKPPTSGLC